MWHITLSIILSLHSLDGHVVIALDTESFFKVANTSVDCNFGGNICGGLKNRVSSCDMDDMAVASGSRKLVMVAGDDDDDDDRDAWQTVQRKNIK